MTRLLMLSLCVLSLAACSNTFQGAGKDIENAGEYIQKSAQ